MKKILFLAILIGFFLAPADVYATPPREHRIGDMGFHGGISESRHLPRTTETIILLQGNNRNNNSGTITMEYMEYLFFRPIPQVFQGTMEVVNEAPDAETAAGRFTVTHRFFPNESTPLVPTINRNMVFDVEYRREGQQMIYTYRIRNSTWRDVIEMREWTQLFDIDGNPVLDGEGNYVWTYLYFQYVLDHRRSTFWVSVIEDRTPGVNYYRGDVTARLFYQEFISWDGGSNGGGTWERGGLVTIEKSGQFHGYSSAWSATETHRMDVTVTAPWAVEPWGLPFRGVLWEAGVRRPMSITYQIRPSVTVNKLMQFVHNEPTIISFEGNFRELHQSFAGLRFDIFTRPNFLWMEPDYGVLNMHIENIFEQLPAPNMSHIRGHSAEDDIHRLFAMQILRGDPRFFVPEQAISRGQFMTALARAINLPIQPRPTGRGRQAVVHLFSDVSSERPEFSYIQAIVDSRVAFGRADGSFSFDEPISRQEAAATVVRALGLAAMGLDPSVISPFADSDSIANWAIRYTNIALNLGLIAPDIDGNFHPNMAISNAQAATFLNALINYLREGIVVHYADEIVNIVR